MYWIPRRKQTEGTDEARCGGYVQIWYAIEGKFEYLQHTEDVEAMFDAEYPGLIFSQAGLAWRRKQWFDMVTKEGLPVIPYPPEGYEDPPKRHYRPLLKPETE